MMFLFSLFASQATACTTFTMPPVEGEHLVGRSVEFGGMFFYDFWQLRTHPVGEKGGWTENYGFVSFDVRVPTLDGGNELDFISEGMNTEGLTMSTHTLQKSEYQNAEVGTTEAANKHVLSYFDVLPYVLGHYSTVDEAIAGLQQDLLVVDPIYHIISPEFRIQWPLSDSLGNMAVIEYLDGKMKVTLNSVGVVTNDPTYDWHLYNLDNYINLNPNPMKVEPGMQMNTDLGVAPQMLGHGSNLLGIPGDYLPASRFVRTYYLRQMALMNDPPTTLDDSFSIASAILDNLRIIRGTNTGKAPASDLSRRLQGGLLDMWEFTQFVVIKQPKSHKFMFRTFDDSQWRQIDLNNLGSELALGAKPKSFWMRDGGSGVLDVTEQLQ